MNKILEACKNKLRVTTSYGALGVEQLCDLSLSKLSTIIKEAKKEIQVDGKDDELSFLDDSIKIDQKAKLTFDVLKEIYIYKKEEETAKKDAAANKAYNEKIDSLIFKKQEAKLEELSVDDLLKLKK